MTILRDYHAPVWNEPVVMELSSPAGADSCSLRRRIA